MHRKFKQLIYLLFYILCWSVVIGGIYFLFLKPAPSCFDKKQNQGEAGIDCGGPCSNVCIPQAIKTISVVDRVVWLQASPNNYVAFAEVKNDNSDFAAKSFDYVFKLYNSDGVVVQTASGQSFMYAGDVRYLFEPNIESAYPVAKATLDISNIKWVSPASFVKPKLRVQDYSTMQSGRNYDVEGKFVNEDTVPFGSVTVVAVFRGLLGQFAGVSQTVLDNVQAGETRGFTVLYPASTPIDVNATQVYVYAAHP